MRLIDADALINEIKKDTKKVIKQDDRVGSFWLGYIAGLVIKQPTIQSALDSETIIRTIETGITATNSNDAYSLGMRNGMRWCKSLIDGAEPKFEYGATRVDDGTDSAELPPAQPEPQWIPVSERLPEVHESGNSVSGIYMQSNPVLVYGTCEYEDNAQFHVVTYCDDLDGNTYWSTELDAITVSGVIAWMPLPEAYKPNNK